MSTSMLPHKQPLGAAAGQPHQRCTGELRPAHSSRGRKTTSICCLRGSGDLQVAGVASSSRSSGSQVPMRPTATAASAAVLGLAGLSGATYQLLSSAELPPLGSVVEAIAEVAAAAGFASAGALAAAKLVMQDRFHLEWHRGRLYAQLGVPSSGPSIDPAECIETKPTGDVRGNGAYATRLIPAGSHIADYSGQRLDRSSFFVKYPDGVGDYSMAIDQEYVIDAVDYVACTSTFHPVHMNHSRSANVLRYYCRGQGRVAFLLLGTFCPVKSWCMTMAEPTGPAENTWSCPEAPVHQSRQH
ncbi:hypothetical protein COO60DRAFT_382037 [Scenedesmus sp. NREL 46B-D3]|nr:hypothetical protein COO60DRAFT_382037 [Scenedesmus sp. NREL 46B-D3]